MLNKNYFDIIPKSIPKPYICKYTKNYFKKQILIKIFLKKITSFKT